MVTIPYWLPPFFTVSIWVWNFFKWTFLGSTSVQNTSNLWIPCLCFCLGFSSSLESQHHVVLPPLETVKFKRTQGVMQEFKGMRKYFDRQVWFQYPNQVGYNGGAWPSKKRYINVWQFMLHNATNPNSFKSITPLDPWSIICYTFRVYRRIWQGFTWNHFGDDLVSGKLL